jgi:lipoyl(octanoyl) transferase
MRQAVCFKSAGRHEIRIQGRKIIGSAQRRGDGVFLQHGSILTGPRHIDLLDCLRADRRGDLTRDRLLDATTDLGRLRGRPVTGAELDDLAAILASNFSQVLGLEPRHLRWDDWAESA